ncbi:MAG: hypothetical protein NTW21_26350 [Verrucomicrobia bacterium]|nr:hypothetical protein [Verrucomicrobiota bacterium]
MKTSLLAILAGCLVLPATGEIKPGKARKSLLESDPDVVYLAQTVKAPIMLTVIKEAPVYSDKNGKTRIGFLKETQTVPLEAMTEKAYKVRGQGTRHDISGWVPPWAFASKDPDFVPNLKKLYERQIEVLALIAAKGLAIGMTLDEVSLSKGKPTKSSVRRTATGQSGTWEYIDYETVNHYITRFDPTTGQIYRQFSYATQEEKGKTVVEFTHDVVSAIEETEDRKGGNVRIIVPPVIFGW